MTTEPLEADFRCGHVAIIGRPNVGKSTLLNRLVGHKLSITARKPQTTRHQILGIDSAAHEQIVYVDTPGIHRGHRRAINRYMNRAASSAIDGVDVIVFVIEALRWTTDDEHIRKRLEGCGKPVVMAVNKVDAVREKTALLPFLEQLGETTDFTEMIPVSARHGDNVESLRRCVRALLPVGQAEYPTDQITDRSERFLVSEAIREKLTRRLGQEIPYQLTVEIEEFANDGAMAQIGAVIWVERSGHKQIVIGRGGRVLRDVGTEARRDVESILGVHVFLRLWVKVREGWSDDDRALRNLGYEG